MKRLLIATVLASGFCGLSVAAHADSVQTIARPVTVLAAMPQQGGDMPYMLAKLQNEIQTLQTEVQTLGTLEGQAPGDARYIFDAQPPPNPDNSPIPSGG